MLKSCLRYQFLNSFHHVRAICSSQTNSCSYKPTNVESPIKRTLRILKNDVMTGFGSKSSKDIDNSGSSEEYCDVLIIGSGAIGSSTAYWLKKQAQKGLNVMIVEKDDTYAHCSTTLSVGGLRQQFSIEENVQLSLFTAEFLRNIKSYLGSSVDVNFSPFGYLILANDENSELLLQNSRMQNDLGAKNILLSKGKLQERFPWINVEDISLGCLGMEKEGWFDPWLLMQGLKYRACQLGANFVVGEVEGFLKKHEGPIDPEENHSQTIGKALLRQKNCELKVINFAICVLAAGCNSGEVAKLANIGKGQELLSIPLPVEPRKRYVYCFKCQEDKGPGLNTPLTIDYTGTYFRRDGLGGSFIGGRSPESGNEPPVNDLEVDYDFFYEHVWPTLAHRVPSFEAIKIFNAWAGYYEVNLFDENGFIGAHPFYHNLYFATGFSGHGIQQAPGVGRAISELIIEGRFKTIDLTRFSFDRLFLNQPLYERNII